MASAVARHCRSNFRSVRRHQNIILAFETAQIFQRVPEKQTTSGLWAAIFKYGVRRRATLSVKLPLGAPSPKHHFSVWNGADIYMGLDKIILIFLFFYFYGILQNKNKTHVKN